MAEAANAWIASADRTQRRKAVHRFAHRERKDFRVIPTRLDGVQLREMSEPQRALLHTLLRSGLSEVGLSKVDAIMDLEPLVKQRANTPLLRAASRIRDPGRYYFTVYGNPSPSAPWGLRFDGHHVSLSWTASPDDRISVSPMFLGTEPRQIPEGNEHAGVRVLGREEDRGRSLWESLSPAQQERARVPLALAHGAFYQHRPMFVGDDSKFATVAPVGFPRSEMAPDQMALLDATIELYVGNFTPSVAEQRYDVIEQGTRDAIHFAWGGSSTPGEPSYYRIHSPSFLIEFDNTVPEADHVHSIYRETSEDFGHDLLAAHYDHHHQAL